MIPARSGCVTCLHPPLDSLLGFAVLYFGAHKLSCGASQSELKLEKHLFQCDRAGFFGENVCGISNAFPEAEQVRQGRLPRDGISKY